MIETAAQLVRRLVEAFGDPDAISELLTEEGEWSRVADLACQACVRVVQHARDQETRTSV